MSSAFTRPSTMWRRSCAFCRRNWLRRVTTTTWWSSQCCSASCSVTVRGTSSTSATLFTGNRALRGGVLELVVQDDVRFVSGRSSITNRVLPCPDSLRMSRTPSIFPASTSSVQLAGDRVDARLERNLGEARSPGRRAAADPRSCAPRHAHRAPPRAERILDPVVAHDEPPVGSRDLHDAHELGQRDVGLVDQLHGGAADLREVVRRDVGCHPHRDSLRAVHQQVGKRAGSTTGSLRDPS